MSQIGVVQILLPVIILVTISLVALGNVQTTTKFDDASVQGIITKNENTKTSVVPHKVKIDIPKEDKVINKKEIRVEKEELEIENNELEDEDIEEDENEDEASESAEPNDDEGIQELRAISKFPLRIDLSTNQLIMTKNGVERVLTTLPAKAVQNMLRAHLKKGLGPKFFQATASATPTVSPSATPEEEPIATESADITILEDQISLEEVSGQVVYKIPAKKHLRLLGFIPVTTDLTGFVSAQTGVLIEERQSLLSRILDLLSP